MTTSDLCDSSADSLDLIVPTTTWLAVARFLGEKAMWPRENQNGKA